MTKTHTKNEPLPDAALAELDRLHAAATPGEWRPEVPAWNKHRRNCKTAISSPTGTVLNTITPKVPRDGVIGYRPPGECKIAQYISALHNAYPALRQRILDAESRLAEVERERDAAEALVAGLRGALEDAGDVVHACVCEIEEIRGKVCHPSCTAINAALALTAEAEKETANGK